MLEIKVSQLLKELALAHDHLVDLNIASTDSYTGEFGEFYACRLLNLKRFGRSCKGADAYDCDNRRYQIKAQVLKSSQYNYSIRNLKPDFFDILVVVQLNERFELIGMYTFDSFSELTSIRINNHNAVDNHKLNVSKLMLLEEERKALVKFAAVYQNLKTLVAVRSSNLVGDIGEYLAAKRLNLSLAKTNQKGYDAIDSAGKTYEIKTRRVYDSNRRISDTRRINNLVGKQCDFVIIVVLDHTFQCAGMWILDPKMIINSKSANLKIVNTTEGVKSLVPSKISYLKDREYYEAGSLKSNPKSRHTKPLNKALAFKKKKEVETKKYSAVFFVIPTMLIYYLVIKPNSTPENRLWYYLLFGLFAYYLFRKLNDSNSRKS